MSALKLPGPALVVPFGGIKDCCGDRNGCCNCCCSSAGDSGGGEFIGTESSIRGRGCVPARVPGCRVSSACVQPTGGALTACLNSSSPLSKRTGVCAGEFCEVRCGVPATLSPAPVPAPAPAAPLQAAERSTNGAEVNGLALAPTLASTPSAPAPTPSFVFIPELVPALCGLMIADGIGLAARLGPTPL